jgi:muramoyltetrapeptide carboxypeptidase
MIIPPYLQLGDTVGITCPAGYIAHERTAYCIEVLARWGYKVKVGRTVGTGQFYFSGNDEERLDDLQAMLDDDSVRAILTGRGGYGTSRIIDALDFTRFRERPKWICGFSDITALHSHLHATMGIATLHSPMCGAFTAASEDSYYIQSLRQALAGETLNYTLPASPYNREGSAGATIVGGNLAMLAHLSGSVSQLDTQGKILFIEDIGEHLYNIDRLLLNLKRSGQLAGLAGLLVGSFTNLQDTERPFGQTLEEIIRDKVADYDFPVAFNFPCGHDMENVTLALGMHAILDVHNGGASLKNNLPVLL